MKRTDVVVIGAGQAGLAMSRSLTVRDIAHVVLERGRIGERWRSERWHSLRLLTSASHSALPGLPHAGVGGDRFLSADAFADYLDTYAGRIRAPVYPHSAVIAVEGGAGEYRTTTASDTWQSRAVVIATGDCDTPRRPACADALSLAMVQIAPRDYRAPDELPDGGVLIVGASSTGVQQNLFLFIRICAVLNGQGELVHRGGITPAPGLYAMGLRYMRRRRSHFIPAAASTPRTWSGTSPRFSAAGARLLSPPPSGHLRGQPHHHGPEGDGERAGVRGSQWLQPINGRPGIRTRLEAPRGERSLAAAPHPDPLPQAGRGDPGAEHDPRPPSVRCVSVDGCRRGGAAGHRTPASGRCRTR